jgi:peptidoglycan-N-acetylglucosamine deacetylase
MKLKNKVIILSILLIFIVIAIKPSKVIGSSTLQVSALSQNKVIYLTFDDGPSNVVTNKVLDILKEKKVKATFFVVGHKIQGREKILRRINAEGHSVGLHTYTHEYKKIYASQSSFINEMDKTREEICRLIGVSPFIIRFPSGSQPYLNKNFLDLLHQRNYKVYDWNAALSDGLHPYNSPDKFLKESYRIYGDRSRVILLMHCNDVNVNTCRALPRIIEYYKQQGYVFKTITNGTPEFHFMFK